MNLSEKAAYLKGLIEGLGIQEDTKEGKVIRAMSDLLQELAVAVDGVEADVEALNDDLDDLDALLREAVLEDEEEPDKDEADGGEEPCYEVDCPNCGATVYVSEADLEEKEAFCESCGKSFGIELAEEDGGEETAQYEVTCPSCGASNVLSEEELSNDEVLCPSCGKPLIPDAEDEE